MAELLDHPRFRDELLDQELFTSVREAAVLAEELQVEYNQERPHMSLGYLTPAEFAACSAGPVLHSPALRGRLLTPRRSGRGCSAPGTKNGGIPLDFPGQ
jgi:hypothetical protein